MQAVWSINIPGMEIRQMNDENTPCMDADKYPYKGIE